MQFGLSQKNAKLDVPHLGQLLGIADSASNSMLHCTLLGSGTPIVAGAVQRVTHPEQQKIATKEKIAECNNKIYNEFKEGRLATAKLPRMPTQVEGLLEDDQGFTCEFSKSCDNPEAQAGSGWCI